MVAVADGVTAQLTSAPRAASGRRPTDSAAPTQPQSVLINPPGNSNYININNCSSVPVTVVPAGSSVSSDLITLTVSSSGLAVQPFTQTYAGGSNR